MIRKNLAAELAELNKDYAGKPDPFSEQLVVTPENPKVAEAREDLKRWRSFAKEPWAPPEGPTETAIAELEDQPNIWLDAAVNLMAFGQIEPPAVDNIECGARRIRAIRALSNLGIFSLTRDGALVDQQEEIPQSLWPHIKIKPADKFIEWLRCSISSGQHIEDTPEQSTQSKAIAATPPGKLISSGRGAMERAIEAAFLENFPEGMPPGTSSQTRNDTIRDAVKLVAGRAPHHRTIQRVLKKLSG